MPGPLKSDSNPMQKQMNNNKFVETRRRFVARESRTQGGGEKYSPNVYQQTTMAEPVTRSI